MMSLAVPSQPWNVAGCATASSCLALTALQTGDLSVA